MSNLPTLQDVLEVLRSGRFRLDHEWATQADIETTFAMTWGPAGAVWRREVRLSPKDRPDFEVETVGGLVLIEVKHKRAKLPEIVAQIARYAAHEQVAGIILATGMSRVEVRDLGLRVPVELVQLGRGWL